MARSPESTPIKAADLLDDLARQVRRTLRTADATQVHHLRVAVRRFRQALAIVENHSAPPGVKNIHRRLKKVMALAGDVRDCDIAAKLAGKLKAPAGLLNKLLQRRKQAQRLLLSALRRWLDRKTGATWRAKLASLEKPPAKTPVEPVLLKAAQRLFNRGRKIGESAKALHRLRIAAKKLRYTMEIAGHADQTRLDQIKMLQTHLGDINDYETARTIVAEEGAGKKISDDLKQSQRKKIREFRHHWNHDFEGKQEEWMGALMHTRKRA